MKRLILVSFVFICISCSSNSAHKLPKEIRSLENLTIYSGSDQQPDTVTLQKKHVYGNNGVVIGGIAGVAVDNLDRVYIADSKQLNISVFNPDGRLLVQLGREGKGPGEFIGINKIEISDNKLFAEGRLFRKVVFSLDSLKALKTVQFGQNEKDLKIARITSGADIHVLNNGTFLVGYIKSTYPDEVEDWANYPMMGFYYLLDKQGRINSKQLFKIKDRIVTNIPRSGRFQILIMTPFFSKSSIAISNENYIYTNWSSNFLIKVYGPDGSYRHAFYYFYDKVPLTKESATTAGIEEGWVKPMDDMNLPATWPAVHDIIADGQNRLWVATIVKDMQVYQWWVLDKTGKLLARFQWPREKKIKRIRNGNVYTVETDKETGIQQVVKYSMQMN